MDLKGSLILLQETELDRIGDKIWTDFQGARSNHDARIARFRRYIRMWRSLPMGGGNVDDGANFEVPTVKWNVFAHWSRVMQGLLGDDAEIVASAKAPSAMKIGPKVGRYMTWRFFEYMKAQPQLSAWTFRSILNGRAHAYCPYEQEFYMERDVKTGKDKPVCWYDGPKLTSLYPSEIVLPTQDDAMSVDDHSFVIRRARIIPDELLEGEERGLYEGVKRDWEEIVAMSKQRQERNFQWDDEKIDVDEAEGVNHAALLGNRDSLEVWTWYSKWRLPNSKRDARPENIKLRDIRESELVATYLPDMRKVYGVRDLRQIYPKMRKRRPFVEIGLVKDGSYWCPGLGEMLEAIQYKQTANYALYERAGKFSVGPLIFYRPSSGFDPKTFVYEPNTSVPSEDPAGVKIVQMTADLQFSISNQQMLDGFGEKVVGVNDQTVGRSLDRPNAPQTATGQIALLEQGNVRASLDMDMIREDLSQSLEFIWMLDREFSSPSVFFRATEEDADGLYDTKDGFGSMTVQEREHAFDFILKFATSVWSREAAKERLIQIYPLLLSNPLVQQNPRAMWVLMAKLWDAFAEGDFSEIIPRPPDLDQPKQPKEEWAMALEGLDIEINPADDDDAHILDHKKRVLSEEQTRPDLRDDRAIKEMLAHIIQHEQQKRQKMLLQALVQRVQQELQDQGQPQPGAPAPGGPPANGVPSPEAPAAAPAINTPANARAVAAPTALGGPPQ